MKIIPPIFRDNNSNAEQKIFNLIKEINLGPDWVAFHSLNVSKHDYKKWSEIDFVILGPKGLFGFEVKGGRVSCQDGIWSFTDRYGETHKRSHGPFEQVKKAVYGLRDYLKEKENFDIEKLYNLGWGVIFPDIRWDIFSPEMPAEILCDQSYTINEKLFGRYLINSFNYWIDKNQNKKKEIPQETIKKIEGYLRPNFDVAPSLNNLTDQIYKKIVQFTAEQYYYLDSIETQERIVCSGGAGSGKSFLAVETAIREASKNRRVLVTAVHPIFISYLKKQFTEKNISKYNLTILPFNEVIKNITKIGIFDSIIVDEAQDCMNFEDIDVLNKLLDKELEFGRWRFFMDENAQSGILGKFDQEAFELIKSYAVYQKLIFNCRNTEQIVNEVELTTGSHLGETKINGKGPIVNYVEIENDEDELDKISKHLDMLSQDKINLYDIAILSPSNLKSSNIYNLKNQWKKYILEIDENNVTVQDKPYIIFSSIKDFKGLERKHILIVDTNRFMGDEKNLKSLLYIGMTRAQIDLWIAVRKEFKVNLINLQKMHVKELARSNYE